MPTLTEDLRFRGLIHQVTDESILGRLDAGGVTAYIGFDPTARSLHVGNLVQLVTLRRLQLAGNRPIVVAGGGTGLIGDPGGRDDERQLLSEAEVASNIAAVREQLVRYLDFDESAGDAAARARRQRRRGSPRSPLIDFLRDVGKHFTVNQMIAKESVRSRLDRADGGISYAEFSYMLLQSYDFYRLHVDYGCDLQLGGSDQWGNITLAIELVKKLTGDQAFGVTTPLLTKPDGTKLGKSTLTDEFVWLDRSMASPFQLYQYFVTLDDDAVGASLRMLTFVPHDEILELDEHARGGPGRARRTPSARLRGRRLRPLAPGCRRGGRRLRGALRRVDRGPRPRHARDAHRRRPLDDHRPRRAGRDAARRAAGDDGDVHVERRGTPCDRPGRHLPQQPARRGRRRGRLGGRSPARSLPAAAARQAPTAPRRRWMRRVVALAAATALAAGVLAGCGATQSPAMAVDAWASAGAFEQAAQYLIVDARHVHTDIDAARTTATVRTDCLYLINEADGENTDLLPTPDDQLTSLLSKSFDGFVHAGHQCYGEPGRTATLVVVDAELRGALGQLYAAVFREEAVTGRALHVPGLP